MDQDWDAVAKAISDRIAELGIRQRDLADRAEVGLSTVQELANNWKPRKRNPKTLAAISQALGWPHDQLQAIASGETTTGTAPVSDLSQRAGRISRHSSAGSLIDMIAGLDERLRQVETRLHHLESERNSVDNGHSG